MIAEQNSEVGAKRSPYRMTISLNVLNHLGIGLYSNVPAVLSEIVANSWDADADLVTIFIDPTGDTIIITDDGIGMTETDINDKYLMVGYRKRDKEPPQTAKGRDPMGRKGIGKLSVFSIANSVEVHSVKDDQVNGFLMIAQDIENLIKDGKSHEYKPTPVPLQNISITKGTRIILRNIKKDLSMTEGYLRKRLARRFSIIGVEHGFQVEINKDPISAKDRDFYNSIEFLWYTGYSEDEAAKLVRLCKNLKRHVRVDNVVEENEHYKYTVKGWIATIDEQKNIDEENNTIVIFAHGKLIQEDMLKYLKEGGVYSKYLIGEIDADFMDLNNKDDVVTSDRQSVKENDPRYKALRKYVHSVLKQIQMKWTDWRTETGTERALEQPVIKEWYNTLQGDNKRYAQKMFGKIESLKVPDREAKRELYKSSLLAFERLALKNALSLLDTIEDEKDFQLVANLFADIDEIEAVHYYQIVKGRLEVIRRFENILPDAKERVLQQHIFDHLWLLDPSWERASSNMRIEEAVTKEFGKINAGLTDDERKGRIDIRYRTAAGKHIIIELKKYDRVVTAFELAQQVDKYRSALDKCLQTKFPTVHRVIEAICIVGSVPEPSDREEANIQALKAYNARYITYDNLLDQTRESYREYLDKEKEVSKLIATLDEIDRTFL